MLFQVNIEINFIKGRKRQVRIRKKVNIFTIFMLFSKSLKTWLTNVSVCKFPENIIHKIEHDNYEYERNSAIRIHLF